MIVYAAREADLKLKFYGRLKQSKMRGAMTTKGKMNKLDQESIPLYYDAVSYGDIFEADERGDELVLRRVVKRANRRNYSYLLSESACESRQLADFLCAVETLGGFWEHFAVGLLLVSMPADSTYDPTAEVNALP